MPKVKLPKAECTQYDLPPVCIVTGSPDNIVWKEVKFQYMPQWAFFFGGVILGSIFMKKMTAELPFSEEAYRNYKRSQAMAWVAVISFFALFFGGIGGAAALDNTSKDLAGILGVGGFLLGIIAPIVIYVAFIRNRAPRCLWMNDEFVEVVLPSQAAIDAIRERFGADRTKPRGLFG
jgi:hypothetical protein